MRLKEIIHKEIKPSNIFNTLEIIKKYPISSLKLIKSSIKYYNLGDEQFKFSNMVGGDAIKHIAIHPNVYEYRIDEYESFDETHLFNLIKLGAIKHNYNNLSSQVSDDLDFNEDDNCGYLIIDKKRNEATIQSLNNYTDCLKCIDKKIDYRVGDILMQILLINAIKKKINRIILTDNSYLACDNVKLQIIYLTLRKQNG